jgi:Cu2+-exporting ATPase
MQAALDRKNPAELMVRSNHPPVCPGHPGHCRGLFSSLWFFSSPGEEALLRSLTVLVTACPCALGIAIPILVKLASVGLAKSRRSWCGTGRTETAKDLDVLVFDKTGTLTEGNFHLQEMVTDAETGPDPALSLIAAVEAHSGHFLARETLQARKNL